MAQFDPSDASVDEVLAKLRKADKDERDRILAAEAAGKSRKTVLEKYGVDPDARYDADGRQLYPWEVTGDDMADANKHPKETAEQRKAREAQAEFDDTVAATTQLGSSPPGSGAAPAAPAATGGAPAAGARGGPAGGTPTAGTAGGTTGGTV